MLLYRGKGELKLKLALLSKLLVSYTVGGACQERHASLCFFCVFCGCCGDGALPRGYDIRSVCLINSGKPGY